MHRRRDNGVRKCRGAAAGSAPAGLGTAAPLHQADRRQEEDAEEDLVGEDDVQEELWQQR